MEKVRKRKRERIILKRTEDRKDVQKQNKIEANEGKTVSTRQAVCLPVT
jgi:hypothetical protein